MINSQAQLFYGYLCEKEVMPWDNSDMTWQEVIVSRFGIHPPNLKFKGNEDKFKTYWKTKDENIKKLGVTVEIYGLANSVKYAFCIKDSLIIASREFPEVIKLEELKIHKEWNRLLREFCRLVDIDIEEKDYINKFKWYLTNYVGV